MRNILMYGFRAGPKSPRPYRFAGAYAGRRVRSVSGANLQVAALKLFRGNDRISASTLLSYTPSASRLDARRRTMSLFIRLRSLVRQDEGQDLLEYALLVALIALVAVAAVTAAGTSVNTIFSSIAAALGKAAA